MRKKIGHELEALFNRYSRQSLTPELEKALAKFVKQKMKTAFDAAQETHDWDVGPRPDYNVNSDFNKWFKKQK